MELLESIDVIVQTQPLLAYLAVYLGGLATAANPCVLVTIPLIIGYVGGYASDGRWKSFLYSVSFTLGLATTFTILGLIASLIGGLFGDVGAYWQYIVAAVAVVMGLHLLGVLNLKLPDTKILKPKRRGIAGSFLLGLLFGVISSPCATPVLAVILMLVSTQQQILYGTSLLFTYAIGHSMLLLFAGTFTGLGIRLIESRGLGNVSLWAKRISGGVIILAGVSLLI